MSCRWCKKDVAPSAKFCPQCGASDPYEDHSMSTIESIKYLLSIPSSSNEAWARLIFTSIFLYFSTRYSFVAIKAEGGGTDFVSIALTLFVILMNLFFIYAWYKAFNYIFSSDSK